MLNSMKHRHAAASPVDGERPTHRAVVSRAITRFAETWQAGDLDAMLECFHPRVIFHYGGTSPYAGVHQGRDHMESMVRRVSAHQRLLSVDQVDDLGDSGAVFVTVPLVLDGEVFAVWRAFRCRVAGDRIVECWVFDHDQHLLDRSWNAIATADAEADV